MILKGKNYYDEQSQIEMLQSEPMDFQTHLYRFREMEQYLTEIGFAEIKTYSSFSKDIAINDKCGMFLFECSAEY